MIPLHTLQEKCGIHAEGEDFLQISDIVVQEWELANWKRIYWLLGVLIPDLGTKIVDLDHGAVIILQEVNNVRLFISVETLKTFRWESTRNNTIGNVGEIKIIVTSLEPLLVSRDDRTYPITSATRATSFRRLFLLLFLRFWGDYALNLSVFISLRFSGIVGSRACWSRILLCWGGLNQLTLILVLLLCVFLPLNLFLVPDALWSVVIDQF